MLLSKTSRLDVVSATRSVKLCRAILTIIDEVTIACQLARGMSYAKDLGSLPSNCENERLHYPQE